MRYVSFRKLGEWMATSLVVLALLIVIAWFTVPPLLHLEPQIVLTGSMEPKLPVGAVAYVKPKSPAQVRVGDVLTFKHPDHPETRATHRVVSVEKVTKTDGTEIYSFRTKGDANAREDDWVVPQQNVVGTVQYVIPYVGYVTDWVRSPAGFIALLILPAAYLAFGELRGLVKELRDSRNRTAEESGAKVETPS